MLITYSIFNYFSCHSWRDLDLSGHDANACSVLMIGIQVFTDILTSEKIILFFLYARIFSHIDRD